MSTPTQTETNITFNTTLLYLTANATLFLLVVLFKIRCAHISIDLPDLGRLHTWTIRKGTSTTAKIHSYKTMQ